MIHQLMADTSRQHRGDAHRVTAPESAVRVVGALLALAVAAVHVADQGGVTALGSPAWMGWSFRLIEAGGVLTALVLLLLPLAPAALAWAGWAAGALLDRKSVV